MVDQLRFAGSILSLCQLALIGQHIDEGRLSHIRPPYKGVFRPVGPGAALNRGAAYNVFCTGYVHVSDSNVSSQLS